MFIELPVGKKGKGATVTINTEQIVTVGPWEEFNSWIFLMKSFQQLPSKKRDCLRLNFRNEGAFTLMELLVTIGIIGVLGMIFLTALGRAKLKGYTVYSQNNLRQLAAAYIAHDVEMGEFMNYKQVRQGNWVKMIRDRERYKKELFHSPAAIANSQVGPGTAREDWAITGPESTYEYLLRI